MGTVRLILRTDKPSADGTNPIELIYQLNGKRKYFRTKERIRAGNWDGNDQRAIYLDKKEARRKMPGVDYDLLPSSKEAEELNNRLTSLRNEISGIEKAYEINGVAYSVDMVVDKIRDRKKPTTKKDAPTNQVFDFIDQYIAANAATIEPGSLSVYKSLKNHLSNYQAEQKKSRKDQTGPEAIKYIPVTFETIDYAFFKSFQNYLLGLRTKILPNGMSNITVAKQLSTLKTFLNYARRHGINVSDKYKDFEIRKEKLEVIALTNEEFETLFNLDLSNNKSLAQVRDVFCFSCATGFRYSDLAQLKREHIKSDAIRLTVKKTKQLLCVPLNSYSQTILNRYSEKLRPLPIISNQKMNDYLKALCKLAEINEPVQIVRFRGNKKEETTYLKHQLISCHTGRKTFCTLSLEKGMSAEEVMQISGHSDYQSFRRYVHVTEKRTKFVMSKAWGHITSSVLESRGN